MSLAHAMAVENGKALEALIPTIARVDVQKYALDVSVQEPRALRERAQKAGIDESAVEEALNSDEPCLALIDLITQHSAPQDKQAALALRADAPRDLGM